MKCIKLLFIVFAVLLPLALFGQVFFDPPLDEEFEFPDTPQGDRSIIELEVFNSMRSPITVMIEIEDENFNNDPNQHNINPLERATFDIIFSPGEVGLHRGNMIVVVRMVNQVQTYEVRLAGRCVEAGEPELSLEPDNLRLLIDDFRPEELWVTVDTLFIRNMGEGDLEITDIIGNNDWLQVDPDELTIEADNVRYITVSTRYPDDEDYQRFEGSISFQTNDPDHERVEIEVLFRYTNDWELALTHSILITTATIGGESLVEGDEIYVFTPDGLLAGRVHVEDDFPCGLEAFGDDPWTHSIDGFRNGEEFSFVMWDRSENEEIEAYVNFVEGPETFELDALSVVQLSDTLFQDPQIIRLVEGWSMISGNRDLSDEYMGRYGPLMRLVFDDIVDQVFIIKDGRGRFSVPEFNYWGVDIWNSAEGYIINVYEDTELELHGDLIPFDRPIELRAGWNMIAYYPGYMLMIFEAMDYLTDRDLLILAKNGRGEFFSPVWNYGGEWQVRQGEGLQVYVSDDCQLIYPAQEQDRIQESEEATEDTLVHFPKPKDTGRNMSILFRSIEGLEIIDGAEMACFTPAGLLAGAMVIDADEEQWGLTAWGDDPFTENVIDGFRDGEEISFLYWDPLHNWELEMSLKIIEGNEIVYHTNGLILLSATLDVEDPGTTLHPFEFNLTGIYPNPFNSEARIEFTLPKPGDMVLDVYDLTGRLVVRLLEGSLGAGLHSAVLDGRGLQTGLYLVVLESGENRAVIRAVLIK